MLGLPKFFHEHFDKHLNTHSIIDLMTRILKYNNKKGPVLKNTIPLFDDENNNESISHAMITNNSEESKDRKEKYTTHFGGSLQTESQLSTARLVITNAPNNNEVISTSSHYKHALPVFEDIMNSCKKKKQFEDFVNMMKTQHYKHVSKNSVLSHNNTTRSKYVFEQNETNQSSIPRKKFAYE